MAHGIVSVIPGSDIKGILIVSIFLQFLFVPFMGQEISFWLECDYIYGKYCVVTSMEGKADVPYLTTYTFSGRNIMNQPLYRATFS